MNKNKENPEAEKRPPSNPGISSSGYVTKRKRYTPLHEGDPQYLRDLDYPSLVKWMDENNCTSHDRSRILGARVKRAMRELR